MDLWARPHIGRLAPEHWDAASPLDMGVAPDSSNASSFTTAGPFLLFRDLKGHLLLHLK
jgi:hypothetical protein